MKTKELIEALSKQDPELEVLVGDNDDWYYDANGVGTARVYEGRLVEDNTDNGQLCVVIG